MLPKLLNQFRDTNGSQAFNMTAIIDIVFLLIIFFLVVCQFIEAENFPVDVPDDCRFAQADADRQGVLTTVTVMNTDRFCGGFAVGAEQIDGLDHRQLVERLAESIDVRLKDIPAERRIVTLRMDKDVCFSKAQYALAAIAKSMATDIQLSTLKDRRPDNR